MYIEGIFSVFPEGITGEIEILYHIKFILGSFWSKTGLQKNKNWNREILYKKNVHFVNNLTKLKSQLTIECICVYICVFLSTNVRFFFSKLERERVRFLN